jgi:cyanophycin synthetase
LARVKQVVVESVERDGAAVLNADDPLVAEMAAATDAEVIYFSVQPQNHIVAAHRAAGRRAVLVHDRRIVLAQDATNVELVELDRIPFTASGAILFQVQNALAAAAAAWAAGMNPALIARALTTFTTDVAAVPGRFNISDVRGVQVILDYAHNPAAFTALAQAVGALEPRRTVLVLALPGDRRDEDLRASVEATKSFAHAYVLYESINQRGRAEGETPQLLQSFLDPATPCAHASDVLEAARVGWQHVQPGDRLIVIVASGEHAEQVLHIFAQSSDKDIACVDPISLDGVMEHTA